MLPTLLCACLTLGASPLDSAHSGATFSRVFGARIGSDSPKVLTRRFGKGTEVVRHFWEPSRKTYIRDDGWNWWRWQEGNADVQCYWEPAYPVSKRKITTITICEKFGTGLWPSDFMKPSSKDLGWLAGIKIGMDKGACIARFERLFVPQMLEFGRSIWRSGGAELAVSFENGRLSEINVYAK
jgi:hypothetical protein